MNVLTGVIADHSYPAADFDFVLQAPGGRLFKLECPICEPAMIGGTLGVYWILLRPSESAAVATLPLAQFFYIDSASHWQYLCTRNNEKSLLTVSIHGRKWPTFASKPEAYWTGTASATTPIACDSKG